MATVVSWFGHPFVRHAFVAVTALAPVCGMAGFFAVLRNQVFAADALGHVAFTGALAALAFGVDQRVGLYGGVMVFAAGLALLSSGFLSSSGEGNQRASDVVTGVMFSWILGLGALFLSLFTARHSAGNGAAGPNVLFGSVFGISASRAWEVAVVSLLLVLILAAVARPLLYASVDAVVAASRGVPVRALNLVLLGAVGVVVAQAVQVVGALLALGLLVTPAATVQRLTNRPYRALGLSMLWSLLIGWAGLVLSLAVPSLPPSFTIVSLGFAGYCIALRRAV